MNTQALKRQLALNILLVTVMALLLAACATDTPVMEMVDDETTGLYRDSDEAGGAQAGDVAAGAASVDDEEQPEQSDDVAVGPDEVNVCLDCHSDKEQLIANASQEEEVVEESEGEG